VDEEYQKQRQLMLDELEEFGKKTRSDVSKLSGSDRKAYLLSRFEELKSMAQKFETRSLTLYANEMAYIDEDAELSAQKIIDAECRRIQIKTTCELLLTTFLDHYDLLKS
jgi:hypothetical protein